MNWIEISPAVKTSFIRPNGLVQNYSRGRVLCLQSPASVGRDVALAGSCCLTHGSCSKEDISLHSVCVTLQSADIRVFCWVAVASFRRTPLAAVRNDLSSPSDPSARFWISCAASGPDPAAKFHCSSKVQLHRVPELRALVSGPPAHLQCKPLACWKAFMDFT